MSDGTTFTMLTSSFILPVYIILYKIQDKLSEIRQRLTRIETILEVERVDDMG